MERRIVRCLLCNEIHEDMLQHVRLMHPDFLDQRVIEELLSLKPVTQEMSDEDWVCEQCDKQFSLDQVYGELFEGMYHGMPVVSRVCGPCFWNIGE